MKGRVRATETNDTAQLGFYIRHNESAIELVVGLIKRTHVRMTQYQTLNNGIQKNFDIIIDRMLVPVLPGQNYLWTDLTKYVVPHINKMMCIRLHNPVGEVFLSMNCTTLKI